MKPSLDASTLTTMLRRRTLSAYYCNKAGNLHSTIREERFKSGMSTGYLEKYMITSICVGSNLIENGNVNPDVPTPPYPLSYTVFDGLGADNSVAILTLDNTDPIVITYDGGSS
jgi:hypothetical protein